MVGVVAVVGIAAVMGCGKDRQPAGVEVGALELVPSDAELVISVDVRALISSALGPLAQAVASSDPDLSGLVVAAVQCDVSADMQVLVAGAWGNDDDLIIVAEAPRVGEWKNIQCIERASTPGGARQDTALLYEDRGKIRTVPQRGGGMLAILNKNALLISSSVFESETLARAQHADKRTPPTLLAPALANVDPDAHAWVALALTPEIVADMDLVDVAGADGMRYLVGGVQFTDAGMALHAHVEFHAAEPAAAFGQMLADAVPDLKASVAELGLSTSLAESMTTETTGTSVHMRATIAGADVTKLMAFAGD